MAYSKWSFYTKNCSIHTSTIKKHDKITSKWVVLHKINTFLEYFVCLLSSLVKILWVLKYQPLKCLPRVCAWSTHNFWLQLLEVVSWQSWQFLPCLGVVWSQVMDTSVIIHFILTIAINTGWKCTIVCFDHPWQKASPMFFFHTWNPHLDGQLMFFFKPIGWDYGVIINLFAVVSVFGGQFTYMVYISMRVILFCNSACKSLVLTVRTPNQWCEANLLKLKLHWNGYNL